MYSVSRGLKSRLVTLQCVSRSLHVLSGGGPKASIPSAGSPFVQRRRDSMSSSRGAARTLFRSESSSSSSSSSSSKPGKKSTEAVEKKFPYTRLTDSHFQQMSQELTNDLPLQALFAGHRPLMLMDPHIGSRKSAEENNRDYDWFTLPASSPVEEAERTLLPLSIINSMGPFDSKNIPSTATSTPDSADKNSDNKLLGYGYCNWKDETDGDTTIIFAKTQGNNADIKNVVEMLNDRVDEEYREGTGPYPEQIEATSVKRKRRLKMNRHKLKKRRKSQRALKRRLGH